MDEARVVNASPLITLAKVGRLDLLEVAGVGLVVPEAVALALHERWREAHRNTGRRAVRRSSGSHCAGRRPHPSLRSAGLRVEHRVVAEARSRYLGEEWEP